VNSNNEIQGYKMYPMLHFHRKFSSSVTSSLSTDIVITHVLTEEKNTKLGSSQVALIAHTKGKGKPQLSKPSDRDKKKIKCNYCKKKGHKVRILEA